MKKNQKTKQDVIKKSWQIIGKNSFFSISMQDIANYLEIKKSLLYYYFEDKTDLFFQAINSYFLQLKNKFTLIFKKDLTAREKLHELSRIYLKEIEKEPILNLLHLEGSKIDHSIINLIRNIQKEFVGCFEKILLEGKKSGEFKDIDPKFTSFAIIGFMEKIKQLGINPRSNWPEIFINKGEK